MDRVRVVGAQLDKQVAGERAQQVAQPGRAACRGVERGDTGGRLLGGGIRGEDPGLARTVEGVRRLRDLAVRTGPGGGGGGVEIRNGRGRLQLRSDGRVDVLARGLRRRAERGPRAVRLPGEQGLVEPVQLGGEGGGQPVLPGLGDVVAPQVGLDRGDLCGEVRELGGGVLPVAVVRRGQVTDGDRLDGT
jgi:hypothetical protein